MVVKAANSRRGRAIHRWVGLIVAVYVIMATTSGVIHIIMTNFFSAPPPVMPQGLVNLEQAKLPLAKVVDKIPEGEEVKAINIRSINGGLWYQVITGEGKPFYINAANGEVDDKLDSAYAKQIAESYLNKSGLEEKDFLTAYNDEYLNIFRMLPVYRFDAQENGERVYVSTVTGSVTLYLNDSRALAQKSFSALHKFSFIKNKLLRDIIMALLVTGVLFSTVMGILIFMGRRKKKA